MSGFREDIDGPDIEEETGLVDEKTITQQLEQLNVTRNDNQISESATGSKNSHSTSVSNPSSVVTFDTTGSLFGSEKGAKPKSKEKREKKNGEKGRSKEKRKDSKNKTFKVIKKEQSSDDDDESKLEQFLGPIDSKLKSRNSNEYELFED